MAAPAAPPDVEGTHASTVSGIDFNGDDGAGLLHVVGHSARAREVHPEDFLLEKIISL